MRYRYIVLFMALLLGMTGIVWAQSSPSYVVSRGLSTDQAFVGQTVEVNLSVVNQGAAGSFLLAEAIPAGVVVSNAPGATQVQNTLVWQSDIAANERLDFRYSLVLTPESAGLMTFSASLTPESTGLAKQAADSQLRRAQLTVSLEMLPFPDGSSVLFAGDAFAVQATLFNPTNQGVQVELESRVSSRLSLTDPPLRLELPANGKTSLVFSAYASVAGASTFRLTPSLITTANESVALAEEAVLLIEAMPVPTLPPVQQVSRFNTILSADRLPRIDGLVYIVQLPEGASYVAGSSQIDGRVVADPQRSDNALVFEILERDYARLEFEVAHQEILLFDTSNTALLVLTPEPELLYGFAEAIDLYRRAELIVATPTLRTREGAVILSPVAGTVFRSRDSKSLTIDVPLEHQVDLLINGERVSDDRIGMDSSDPSIARRTLEYLGLDFVPGPNVVRLESTGPDGQILSDELTFFEAGPPTDVLLTPITALIADSATPLVFDVRVVDAWGNVPDDGVLSLEIENAIPSDQDADAQQVGYQIFFQEGRGTLALEPLAEPAEVQVTSVIERTLASEIFVIGSNYRPFIINGYGSVGVSYNFFADADDEVYFGTEASFFARGTVLNNFLLTLAARSPQNRLGFVGDPNDDFPVVGSSGALNQDAYSEHGIFARLERDLSYLQYGDFSMNLEGALLGVTRSYTGVSSELVAGDFRARAYGAYTSISDFVHDQELPSRGVTYYDLGQPIADGSLQVEIIKRDAFDNRELDEGDSDQYLGRLEPLIDYTVDEVLGNLYLARPIPTQDERGNRYLLRLNYRLPEGQSTENAIQFGAQASYNFGFASLRVGAYRDQAEDSFVQVVATGIRVEAGNVSGEIELAAGQDDDNSGLAFSAAVAFQEEQLSAEANYQFVSEDFRSATVNGAESSGQSVQGNVAYALSPELAFSVGGQLKVTPAGTTYGVQGVASYQSASDIGLGSNPNLQVGLNYTDSSFGVTGAVGISELFGLSGNSLSIVHQQPISGDGDMATQFGVGVRLLDNLTLRLTDTFSWSASTNALLVGLETGFEHSALLRAICLVQDCEQVDPFEVLGRTTVIAGYEMAGGVSPQDGRVRLGVQSTYPVNDHITLDGSLEQILELNRSESNVTVVTIGSTYQDDNFDANARYELRADEDGTVQVVTAGTNIALSEALYASLTARFIDDAPNDQQGFQFSIAGAYRGDSLSILSNNIGRYGALREGDFDQLKGELRATLTFGNSWEARAGYIYDLEIDNRFLDMWSLGGNVYAWQGGSVGAYGRYLNNWTTTSSHLGANLEASQRLFCGLYAVGGYNFFDGLGENEGAIITEPGLYFRVDAVVDEQWRCGTANIGDRVFADLNGDGFQQEDEPGVPNVSISLFSETEEFIARTRSDNDGFYRFDDVPTGRYYLVFSLPEGYVGYTLQDADDNPQDDVSRDNVDSDVDSVTGQTDIFRMNFASHRLDIDAGLIPGETE